jgi:cell pole-organizing protein PopZ
MTQGDPAATEPSMEDVLASIRRILDEGKGAEAAEEAAEPAADGGEATEEVFLLAPEMMVEEPAPLPDPPEPADMIIEEPAPMADMTEEDSPAESTVPLLAPEAQTAASSSLGELVRALTERQTQIYRTGPTLEDLVREEMRPMLKSWLDTNLPPMVERLVRDEIERVVRRGMG